MLKIVTGNVLDVTEPKAIIAHVCNDSGGWGKGFVTALGNRYPGTRAAYKTAFKNGLIKLGYVHIVQIGNGELMVANMVAQAGYAHPIKNPVALRYAHLETCLDKISALAKDIGASLHMPYLIGCGLAGGEEKHVLSIIERISVNKYGLDVILYKYNPESD